MFWGKIERSEKAGDQPQDTWLVQPVCSQCAPSALQLSYDNQRQEVLNKK